MIEKKTLGGKVFDVCNIAVMLIFTLLCLYPFYYMLIYSVSEPDEAYGITLLPAGLSLANYKEVFQIPDIGRAAIISILRTVIGTSITVLCCSFFGYLVTKQRMVGRKFIYRLLVVTMYVDGGLIPTFLVLNAYGMMNSYLVYVLPTALSAYNVILVKTFMEQLPASLEESAMLDGAGPVCSWWRIIMPLSKPILATIAVFAAVGQWNSWFDAHIYITKREMWPLQYVLYRLLQQVQAVADAMENKHAAGELVINITPATVRMTVTAVVTIPIIFVYPFMQKYFMKGILIGAVKG